MDHYNGDIKFYFKNFPLNIHRYAKEASLAALAADKQGKFIEYHNKLIENYRSLNEKKFLDIAQELALNIETFNKDRTSSSLNNLVERDRMEGQKIGVRATPTVFINGRLLKRRNFKNFQLRIDAELKKAP